MITDVINWMALHGIVETADYEVVWDSLLEKGPSDKLALGDVMATINQKQFQSGGEIPFGAEQILQASGFEEEQPLPPPSEELTDDE